jgi:hypothetical protein
MAPRTQATITGNSDNNDDPVVVIGYPLDCFVVVFLASKNFGDSSVLSFSSPI